MTRAAAQLARERTRHPRAVDRLARVLIDTTKNEKLGVLAAARLDQALAQMGGFDGYTPDHLKAYFAARDAFLLGVVRRYGDRTASDRVASASVGMVQGQLPTAFTIHVKRDDSYAIGIAEDFIDLFMVLSLAAYLAWARKDIEIYHRFMLHVVNLHYVGAVNPTILEDYEMLARLYRQAEPGLRAAFDDMRMHAIAFVLSHEAAHLELDHFANKGPVEVAFDGPEAKGEISAFATQQAKFADEFAADNRAYEVHLDLTGGTERSAAGGAQIPIMALTILKHLTMHTAHLHVLDRIMRRHHPPEADRCDRLRARADAFLATRPDIPVPYLPIVDFIDRYKGLPSLEELAELLRKQAGPEA